MVFFYKDKLKNISGFSLIEILLGVGILSLVVSVIVGSIIFSQSSQLISAQTEIATDIAEEGIEATRNMRDEQFSSLSAGNNGVATTSGRYVLSGASDVTSDQVFTRVVNIAQTDQFRRKITSTVTWEITPTRIGSVALVSQLTDWRRKKSGGAPSLFGTLDLTVANSGNAVADAISVAFKNPYAYIGRVVNTGSEFYTIDLTNAAVPVLSGQLALSGDPNDMIAIGNYVYISSTDNNEELQIVNIASSTNPTLDATFDLTALNSGNGTANGLSISGSGTRLYYLRANSGGKELIIFDITSPTVPVILGTLDLSGDPNDGTISGNYVYVASTDNATEFQVVDVTVPSLPTLAGTLNLDSGDANANANAVVFGPANTVFLGRVGSAAPEFYVIDVATPSAPSLGSTLDISNLTVNSLGYASSSELAFLVGTNPAENDYKAIDVSTLSSVIELANLNLTGVPNKLIYGVGADKVVLASSADTEEVEIIQP